MTKVNTTKVEHAASSLAALREQLRLNLHLAEMDVGDLWKEELRPQLTAIEGGFRAWIERGLRSAGEARVQAQLGLMEARAGWEAIEPRVSESLKRLQSSSDEGDRAGVAESLRALLTTAREAVAAATDGLGDARK